MSISDINKGLSGVNPTANSIPSQTNNSGKVLGTDGTNLSWVTNDSLDHARGAYDASSNIYPSTGGSGTAGAIKLGDYWIISVAGTLGGETASVNDLLYSNSNNPGQTSSNWTLINNGTYVSNNGSSTDNAIPRFDATTGKIIQNSGVIIDDSNNITGANSLNLAGLTASQAVVTDSSKNLSSLPYSSSSTANSIVTRDANQNISSNNMFEGFTSVAASGSLITLTASSAPNYVVTGSGGQIIQLPDARTLPKDADIFSFNNNQSSGAITVNNNSGTLIASIPSGGYVSLSLLDNTLAAGSWDRHDQAPANVSWSTNTLDYSGSFTSGTWNGNTVQVNRGGTGATTLTGYVKGSGTSALTAASTIPTTDLSGTITNAQLANSAITINGTNTSLGGSISVGTVTSVTGTSPVVSSGGNTPAISMPAATTSVNGYLTSTDWNTFNNKGSGTVTGVGGTGTINGISLSGTVISSGNLTLGGALSGVSLATQVSGTLPIANGGTGATTRQDAIDALVDSTTSGSYLRGNGTDVIMSTIQAADVPTLNQNTTGTASNITATSNSTLTTLSSLSLAGSQVSGNISGDATNVTGTVAIANGGTGQTTQQAAINALTNVSAATAEYVLTKDTATGNAIFKAVSGGGGGAEATTSSKGIAYLSNPITIANNATDANNDINFSAGNAPLDDGSNQVLLTSTLIKRLDASWTAGTNQGGLFSGTKAINTRYYLFAITNGTIIDAGFDTSPTGANIPAGYKGSYRGMVLTDGSGNIRAFDQLQNNYFEFVTPILEGSGITPSTRTALSVSAPKNVIVKINATLTSVAGAGTNQLYLTDLNKTDISVIRLFANINFFNAGEFTVKTNSSSQIGVKGNSPSGTYEIYTLGFFDTKIKN
jgi:hypothetical protein